MTGVMTALVRWEEDHPEQDHISITRAEGHLIWSATYAAKPFPVPDFENFANSAECRVMGYPVRWAHAQEESDLHPYLMGDNDVTSQWDRQEGGQHYKRFKIQPSEYIYRNGLTWFAANIVKYATRAPFKGKPVEDLRKVIHYAQLWIEEITNEREEAEIEESAQTVPLNRLCEKQVYTSGWQNGATERCPGVRDHQGNCSNSDRHVYRKGI